MLIEVKSCLSGAGSSEGVVVIIDVFRAGNTAAALLASGAPFIIAAGTLDEARKIKASNPHWLSVGERKGLRPPGFDMNNSPDQAMKFNLSDRPAILTTSAGTRGLTTAAPRAEVLLMATLVNARALAAVVARLDPKKVTLVPIGLEAREPAVEDEEVASYLADLLAGRGPKYKKTVSAMLKGPGADRLRRLGQWRDLAFCLRLDYLSVVPRAFTSVEGLILKSADRSWPR